MNSDNIFQNKNTLVRIYIEKGNSDKKEYFFRNTFRIGRDEGCAVKINDGLVSREHLEVSYKEGIWQIEDLCSSNGIYLNGEKTGHLILSEPVKLELGKNGPVVNLELVMAQDSKSEKQPDVPGSLTGYIKKYCNAETNNPNVGDHTRMIHQAFEFVRKKQSKKYFKIIISVIVIALAVTAYSIYQHIKENEYKAQAVSMFYKMKELELSLDSLIYSRDSSTEQQKQFREKQMETEKEYDKYVESLGLYKSDEKERLIQKTARAFGECEINMPEEFINEVKKYINYWRSTPKYAQAIQRAKEMKYIQFIVYHLNKRGLPLQLFYLPLKESDFKEQSVGPDTYMGYAKGIWHFIASTAKEYGLKVGPLKDTNAYDPDDERFDFFKATPAATDYLKNIYRRGAQASGLLVLASYNWSEGRVIKYINGLTMNPKERNFWKLLSVYRDKIPQQTYDYVFYIFAAAVIGENPKLFGFQFENPLNNAVQKLNE